LLLLFESINQIFIIIIVIIIIILYIFLMKTFHFRNDRAYAFLIYITFVYHISSLTVLVILYGYFFLNIILSCLYLCIFLFVHF